MSSTPATIAIVDDDPLIRELLQTVLKKEGYETAPYGTGASFRAEMKQTAPDLVILDLTLPDEDGLAICRDLRSSSSTPVIILTSRSEEIERVIGLEMGADDYLSKPVFLRELLARIKRVLGRNRVAGAKGSQGAFTHYRFAGWVLNDQARILTSPAGEGSTLTDGEFRLLQTFLTHPMRVLNRNQLLDLTRGRDFSTFDRSIDNMVSRLRRRFKSSPNTQKIIKTVRGEGYLLNARVEIDEGGLEPFPQPRPETTESASSPGQPRILVVDDDEMSVLTLEIFLKKNNCDVVSRESGAGAVEAFREGAFDLIFMDCRMPGMDGFETCREIRRLEQEAGCDSPVPVIAISYSSLLEEKGKWLAAGMNDFLEKPVRKADLPGLLQRWIPRSRSEGKGAQQSALDNSLLQELRADADDGFLPFLAQMVSRLSERVSDLRRASSEENDEMFTLKVEQIWSSARSVGATRLASLCRTLTEQLETPSSHRENALSDLEEEWKRVGLALLDEMKSGDAPPPP